MSKIFMRSLAFTLLLSVWFGVLQMPAAVPEITKKSYAQRAADSAVVLFSVNWGRVWNCPPYENAELRMLAFDRVGTGVRNKDAPADLIWEGPSRLTTKLEFINYAVLVPAGDYALSGFAIKVAKSVSDVGYLRGGRAELIPDGTIKGGSFTARAGEVVYIGNFFLDRQTGPMLWRYYSEIPEGYKIHLVEFRAKYPFLELNNVQYRLFKTAMFGVDYPNEEPKPPTPRPDTPAKAVPVAPDKGATGLFR
jgi:hypothetical protein